MTISMYNASVPVFKQLLNALMLILDKAETHVTHHKIEPEVLLQASLFPGMYNFIRQVQIATDFAKGVSARLAGLEMPTFEDIETHFHELRERIAKTIEFISSIPAEAINGSETLEIITRAGTPKEKKFVGLTYLLHYGLPQFFFHVTTAYDILRSQGVEIGKRDYMGAF
jgi:uncharacterized protein